MKKNVKNDKVLRAITIGIATMMAATSMPANVYAGEGDAQESSSSETAGGSSDSGSSDSGSSDSGSSDSGSSDSGSSDSGSSEVSFATVDAGSVSAEVASPAEAAPEVVTAPTDEQIADAAAALQTVSDFVKDENIVPEANTLVEKMEPLTGADSKVVAADYVLGQLEEGKTELYKTVNDLDNISPEDMAGLNALDSTATQKLADIEALIPDSSNKDHYVVDDKKDEEGNVVSTTLLNETKKDGTEGPKTETKRQLDKVYTEYKNGIDAVRAATEADNDEEKAKQIGLANTALGNVNEFIKQAGEDITQVEGMIKEVEDAVKAAANEKERILGGAIKDSKAAEAAYKAANDKFAILTDIQEQYENFLIHFYRDSKINSAVYDENGKLDVAKSAAKAQEKDKDGNAKTDLVDDLHKNTYKLGRELLRQLVTYKLIDQGADPASIKFAESGSNKKVAANGKQETITENKFTDDKKNTQHIKVSIDTDSEYTQYWESTRKEDEGKNGRYNMAKVTYKNKDGVECTEYYNYVFKSSSYNDDMTDYSDSPFALFVTDDRNGEFKKDESNPITGIADAKLLAASETELQSLREEINAQAKKVTELRQAIESMSVADANTQKLAELKTKLKNAKAAKENNEKYADELQRLIDSLGGTEEEPIEKKDPNGETDPIEETIPGGGDVVDDDDDDDDDGGDGGDVTETPSVPVFDPGSGELIIPEYEGPSIFVPTSGGGTIGGGTGTTSGVLGERVDPNGNTTNNVVAKNNKIVPQTVAKKNQNKKDSQQLKRIKNDEIPLAEMPTMDDEVEMNWMWLLIIFLLGATGKKMYDEYRKKKEAEENAK